MKKKMYIEIIADGGDLHNTFEIVVLSDKIISDKGYTDMILTVMKKLIELVAVGQIDRARKFIDNFNKRMEEF